MAKKSAALFLLLIMLGSCWQGSALAAEFTIYSNEGFENYVTNARPDAPAIEGAADVIVVERAAGDKMLFVNKKELLSSTLSQKIDGARGSVVFQTDLKVVGERFGGVLRMKSGAQEIKPVTIKENGELCAGDGKKFDSLALNTWVNLAVVYHPAAKRYDVYIDRRCKLSDWKAENASFGVPDQISLEFLGAEGASEVYLDNFRIYSGERLQPDSEFPRKAYNAEATEYVETSFEAGDSIISTNDYNKRMSGSVVAKANKITRMDDEDGNGFARFEISTTDDAMIDFAYSAEHPFVVFQMDVRPDTMTGTMQLFTFKLKPDSTFCWTAYLNPGGSVTLHNGTRVGSLSAGQWHRVAAAYNFLMKSYDFYIDGKCVAKNVAMGVTNKSYPNLVRIHVSSSGKEIVDIDNVYFYEGKEPREITSGSGGGGSDLTEIGKVWPKNEDAIKLLGNATAFHAGSGAMFAGGEKTYPEAAAYIDNKIIYLPLRTLAELYGKSLTWDEEAQAAVLDGETRLAVGSTQLEIGGKTVGLSGPVQERNGAVYIPVDALGDGRLFTKKVLSTWDGLVILDAAQNYQAGQQRDITLYLMFQRPKAAQVKEDFMANGLAGQHPRVMVDQADFDRIKHNIETDDLAKKWYQDMKNQADNAMKAPPSTYVIPDGLRLLSTSRAVLDRVSSCALVYKMSGDAAYAKRAYEELEAAANFPDWNPRHYLDTGEMSAAFAIGYDWLYDYLSGEQKGVVREALKANAVEVYLGMYAEKNWWTTLDSNWSFVCNGGGIMAAVALADELPDECFTMIENAMRSMELAHLRFAPDGGWYEGPGYWGYAMQYYTMLCSTLDTALGTDYDITKSPGFKDTLNFLLNMEGALASFSYSDTGVGKNNPFESMWLAQKFDQPDWAKVRVMQKEKNALATNIQDLLWYYPETAKGKGEISLPLDAYYRNTEVAASRSSWTDSNMLYLAYKGGFANQSHGHLDNGSFVLDLNGVRWANDWGSDDYNLQGYGSWAPAQIYLKRAEAHNTLVINPAQDTNDQDPNAVTKIVRHEQKDTGSIGVVDLTPAYPEDVKSAYRGFKVEDYRNSVVVRDELELTTPNSEIYWFLQTPIEDPDKIEINGKTAVLTASNGSKLFLEFQTNAAKAEMVVMDSTPLPTSPNPQGQKVIKAKKLAIKLKASGKVSLTVKMCDAEIWDYVTPLDDTPIDQWTLPDGALPQRPKMMGIYRDGQMLEGFSDSTTEYKLFRYYEDPEAVITAEAQEGMALEESKAGNNTTFVVRDPENPQLFTKYRVTVKAIPHILEDLSGFTRLKPVKITASDVPEPQNPPENVDDGEIATRFAVDGDGKWIELDFGQVVEIDAYAISYYMGTVRDSYYDILISEDGKNYTTIFEGETSGLTDAYELFKAPGTKLRYFKLVGHCNSAGTWNSPTEIALLQGSGQ